MHFHLPNTMQLVQLKIMWFFFLYLHISCFFFLSSRRFLCWLHFSILIELKCSFLYNLKFKKWSIWNGIDVNILTIVAIRFGIFFSFLSFSPLPSRLLFATPLLVRCYNFSQKLVAALLTLSVDIERARLRYIWNGLCVLIAEEE